MTAIKSTAESKLGTDTATYVGNAVTEVVGGSVNSETVRQVVDYNTSGRAAVQTAAQNAGKGQADAARDAASSAAGNASYSGSANFSNLKALKDQIAAALTPQYMTQYMADGTMDEATAANKAAGKWNISGRIWRWLRKCLLHRLWRGLRCGVSELSGRI